jgi:catechol 2,3-dioxygenase-like lactoylglutathione lyase family enzyme
MAIEGLNHSNVLTDDVERTDRFYSGVLQLHAGPRPPLNSPSTWLYSNGQPVVHVSGGRSREELTPGLLDHVAFSASDLSATLQALNAHGVEQVCGRQVTSGVWQVFFNDPNGAKVELDFPAQEQASP